MIISEQHIALNIYHNKRLRQYDLIEQVTDDEEVSFKVMHGEKYLFTLIPKNGELLRLGLSQQDKDMNIQIDSDLYSKIVPSLYSIFLKEIPS